MHFDFILSHF